jgi:hypothetical protein
MKILNSITIQLTPDATGTAFGWAVVEYSVGSTDDAGFTLQNRLAMGLSTDDASNVNSLFTDVIAQVKAKEGIS